MYMCVGVCMCVHACMYVYTCVHNQAYIEPLLLKSAYLYPKQAFRK